MEFKFDVEKIRSQFPACKRIVNGKPVCYLDGPGGSQVPTRVVEKMNDYLFNHNANEGGEFAASRESDRLTEDAAETMADFLGCSSSEIGFGPASTQNNFNLSFAIARDLKPGDEVIITDIDHRCNRAPWLALEEKGVIVRSVAFDHATQQLDLEDYKSKLSAKTKVAAFSWASNALGTISDVKTMCALAHEAGARTVVDAVHYAPHRPIDVREIGTDALLCSAYKFFGPHTGVIYLKEEFLESLEFYNVKAEDLMGNRKFHFGTPAFESICGTAEAVEFIASIGADYAGHFGDELGDLAGRRRNIVAGMLAIDHYEEPIARRLRTALREIPGIKVYGPAEGQPRTSTVSFTMEGRKAIEVTSALGDNAINTWDGDFYAAPLVNDVLGLRDRGGLVRIGLAPYNTMEEIERTIAVIRSLV